MLRYRPFAIDVIIRRTVIYGIVTGTLATVYAISSCVLQAGFQTLTEQRSALAGVASTLGIAVLFQPVRSWVQTSVDRRCYRRKYDAARTGAAFRAAFSRTLRREVGLTRLIGHLLAMVEEAMQSSQVSLWLAQPAPRDEPDAWRRAEAAEATAARATQETLRHLAKEYRVSLETIRRVGGRVETVRKK